MKPGFATSVANSVTVLAAMSSPSVWVQAWVTFDPQGPPEVPDPPSVTVSPAVSVPPGPASAAGLNAVEARIAGKSEIRQLRQRLEHAVRQAARGEAVEIQNLIWAAQRKDGELA